MSPKPDYHPAAAVRETESARTGVLFGGNKVDGHFKAVNVIVEDVINEGVCRRG
jgi:hypothetical protein